MDKNLLILIAPLIILEIILVVAALVDLARREKVAGGNKLAWAAAILFISTIGPIVYFVFGRKEESDTDADQH